MNSRSTAKKSVCPPASMAPSESSTGPKRCRPPVHKNRRPSLLENGCNSMRSEEHTSELQSLRHLVCRLLLEKKKKSKNCKRHHTTANNKNTYPPPALVS